VAAIHVAGVRCDPCGAMQRIFSNFSHLQAQWFYLKAAHLSNLMFNKISISIFQRAAIT